MYVISSGEKINKALKTLPLIALCFPFHHSNGRFNICNCWEIYLRVQCFYLLNCSVATRFISLNAWLFHPPIWQYEALRNKNRLCIRTSRNPERIYHKRGFLLCFYYSSIKVTRNNGDPQVVCPNASRGALTIASTTSMPSVTWATKAACRHQYPDAGAFSTIY